MITRIFVSPSSLRRRLASVTRIALVLLAIDGVWSPMARGEPGSAEAAVPLSESPEAAAQSQASSRELATWLEQLLSANASSRATAQSKLGELCRLDPAVISLRLSEVARDADRAGMAALLGEFAKGIRVSRDEGPSKPPDGGYGASDWFAKVISAPAPEVRAWREVTTVLALSRILACEGTSPAVRELAALYPTYGEMLRIDVERQLLLLGDRALPTLIELRRGESKELRLWAFQLLDVLGKGIPGEAVQTSDDHRLAEILLAYGRAKDADAVQVIFSFANSDRAGIRAAAREAVILLGDRGKGPLRESYENLVGKKAPAEWGADVLQRELFTALDRARLADVYALMDQGVASYAEKNLAAAVDAFDRVLAREPQFERRKEMPAAYLDFARSVKGTDVVRASSALRQAIRIDPGGPLARPAESEFLLLEARDLKRRGVVPEGALRHAVELDPNNEDAKRDLRLVEAESEDRKRRLRNQVSLVVLAVLALAAGLGIIAKRRRSPA